MKKRIAIVVIALALTAVFAAAILAQGPGPSAGQGQNGPNMAAFKAFQEQTKYTHQLTTMVRHIGEINRDAKYTLSPVQAKKVLAILKPLRSQPKLTQDQAKVVLKQLKPIFTAGQLNAMARIKDDRGGRRGGFGGPGMGKAGAPGAGKGFPGMGAPGAGKGFPGMGAGKNGQRPGFDLNRMKDNNPFFVDKKATNEFAKRMNQRWDVFFKGLQIRAAGGAVSSIPKPQMPAFPKGAFPKGGQQPGATK